MRASRDENRFQTDGSVDICYRRWRSYGAGPDFYGPTRPYSSAPTKRVSVSVGSTYQNLGPIVVIQIGDYYGCRYLRIKVDRPPGNFLAAIVVSEYPGPCGYQHICSTIIIDIAHRKVRRIAGNGSRPAANLRAVGVEIDQLPESARSGYDTATGQVTIRSTTPTAMLNTLTAWAVERGIELAGLSVERPSLEDVYLELTEEAGS